MPLLTDEATAIAIINNEALRRGERDGLINFARLVLGAHSAQAKTLVALAARAAAGEDVSAHLQPVSAPTVSATTELDGRTLNVQLKADRLPITTLSELTDFYAIDTQRWRPTKQVFNFWGSEASPNFQVKASFEEAQYEGVSEQSREELRAWVKAHASLPFEPPAREPLASGKLLEIMVSDLHAGRSAWDEPVVDTMARLTAACLDIVFRADLGHGFERIALVLNGDTFNDDNGKQATTAGTLQESYSDWRATYRAVREGVAELILALRARAPVDVYVLEGNHDQERAWYLADALFGMFAAFEDVTVATTTTRHYIDWGRVLIGLTHGDTIKDADYPLVMAREADIRGKRVLEWHLGHLHTRSEDEVHGVLLRRFRTPAPFDDWHYRKGYAHNVRSITGILWDKTTGEEATLPYAFFGEEAA